MARSWIRRWRRRHLAPAIRLATGVFGLLSWSLAQRVGALLGQVAWLLAGRDRRRCHEHLAIAFPQLPEAERRRLARACFRHLGMSVAELLHVWHRPAADARRHVRVEGYGHVEAARAAGRPQVILLAHCGNWELTSVANGLGLGLTAMARELDDGLHDLAVDLRGHLGSQVIARGSRASGRGLLKVMRSGGALAMLIDQDLRTGGVFVPFFGRLAHTPAAAADIARRFDAVVLPTFVERLADGRHVLTFHPPLDLPADRVAATAVMTMAIEEQIRRCPEQWVWMHRRWRRRPPAED